MNIRSVPKRRIPAILRLISNRKENGEIGDNSLVIDVYRFKRGRELHVFYSLYNSTQKSAEIHTPCKDPTVMTREELIDEIRSKRRT